MSRRCGARACLLALVGLSILLGCAEVPDSGTVNRAGGEAEIEDGIVERLPAEPRPGAQQAEIVSGFFSAMLAIPPSTDVAKKFLTREAATTWDPTQRTVVYKGLDPMIATGATVAVGIRREATLSWRGAYRAIGPTESAVTHRYELSMVDGQWRITNPANALYVDSDYLERPYLPASLYFLAPSADALVPYPIYLSRGDQLATSLVQGLLDGPPTQEGQRPLTAVPPSTRPDGSVSITDDGVAEISLDGPLLTMSTEQRKLLSAQLVWTVMQVSGVTGVRILADGARWDIPSVPAVQDLELWDNYDPADLPARDQLFALDGGKVVQVIESEDPETRLVTGARIMPMANSQWGAQAQGIRSFDIGVNLSQLLGVSVDGDALLIGRLFNSLRSRPRVVYDDGLDLSEPIATRGGEWLVVDRRPSGSRLLVVTADGRVRRVPFGALEQERVQSLALSADGTRLAALAQSIGPQRQGPARLVLGTVRLGGTDGLSVVGVDGVHDLVTSDGTLSDLRSVGWVDATTLGVLGRVGRTPVAPYTVRIDGSQLINEWILPLDLGDPRRLVTSMAPEGGVFVRNERGRLWFEADGEWRPVDAGLLESPTFPG